jgi:hypothetical protein
MRKSISGSGTSTQDERKIKGMRKRVILYIILRIRFGNLEISDILKLQKSSDPEVLYASREPFL